MKLLTILTTMLVSLGSTAQEQEHPVVWEFINDSPVPIALSLQIEQWYAEVARCAGGGVRDVRGNLNARLADEIWLQPDSLKPAERVLGLWIHPDKVIVERLFQYSDRVWHHELLHFHLQHGGHPRPPFGFCACNDVFGVCYADSRK